MLYVALNQTFLMGEKGTRITLSIGAGRLRILGGWGVGGRARFRYWGRGGQGGAKFLAGT